MKDKIESDNNTQTYCRVKERALDNARIYIDKRFDRDRRMRRLNRYETDFAEHVFSLAGANSHFMDAPCGSGRFLKSFFHAKRLTMVDLSPAMLQVAKETAEALGDLNHIRFIEADIKAVPMPNESADVCFSMRLFHHLPDDKARLEVLKELARISKKYIALSFYNKNCIRYYMRKLLRKRIRGRYISFSHFLELAANAGLKCIERRPRINFIEQQCLVILEKSGA